MENHHHQPESAGRAGSGPWTSPRAPGGEEAEEESGAPAAAAAAASFLQEEEDEFERLFTELLYASHSKAAAAKMAALEGEVAREGEEDVASKQSPRPSSPQHHRHPHHQHHPHSPRHHGHYLHYRDIKRRPHSPVGTVESTTPGNNIGACQLSPPTHPDAGGFVVRPGGPGHSEDQHKDTEPPLSRHHYQHHTNHSQHPLPRCRLQHSEASEHTVPVSGQNGHGGLQSGQPGSNSLHYGREVSEQLPPDWEPPGVAATNTDHSPSIALVTPEEYDDSDSGESTPTPGDDDDDGQEECGGNGERESEESTEGEDSHSDKEDQVDPAEKMAGQRPRLAGKCHSQPHPQPHSQAHQQAAFRKSHSFQSGDTADDVKTASSKARHSDGSWRDGRVYDTGDKLFFDLLDDLDNITGNTPSMRRRQRARDMFSDWLFSEQLKAMDGGESAADKPSKNRKSFHEFMSYRDESQEESGGGGERGQVDHIERQSRAGSEPSDGKHAGGGAKQGSQEQPQQRKSKPVSMSEQDALLERRLKEEYLLSHQKEGSPAPRSNRLSSTTSQSPQSAKVSESPRRPVVKTDPKADSSSTSAGTPSSPQSSPHHLAKPASAGPVFNVSADTLEILKNVKFRKKKSPKCQVLSEADLSKIEQLSPSFSALGAGARNIYQRWKLRGGRPLSFEYLSEVSSRCHFPPCLTCSAPNCMSPVLFVPSTDCEYTCHHKCRQMVTLDCISVTQDGRSSTRNETSLVERSAKAKIYSGNTVVYSKRRSLQEQDQDGQLAEQLPAADERLRAAPQEPDDLFVAAASAAPSVAPAARDAHGPLPPLVPEQAWNTLRQVAPAEPQAETSFNDRHSDEYGSIRYDSIKQFRLEDDADSGYHTGESTLRGGGGAPPAAAAAAATTTTTAATTTTTAAAASAATPPPPGERTLSREDLKWRIEAFNDNQHGLLMTLSEKSDTFQGFIRVYMNLMRPISMSLTARPPSIYDILTPDQHDPPETDSDTQLTSFYLPKDTTKVIHITSHTTAQEVIRALLQKFRITDNPRKFALYERVDEGSSKSTMRRLRDDECPLALCLSWTAEGLNFHRFILQENDTGEIMWEAFSIPELDNFLKILDREEEEYVEQVKAKYQLMKLQMKQHMKHLEQQHFSKDQRTPVFV